MVRGTAFLSIGILLARRVTCLRPRAEDFAVAYPQHAATGHIVFGGIVAAVLGPTLGAGRAPEEEIPVIMAIRV